jgi:hypothetical protein
VTKAALDSLPKDMQDTLRAAPAETIPDDLVGDLSILKLWDARGKVIIRTNVREQIRLIERTGRAETRIEVLEAALRNLKTAVWKNCGQVRLLKMQAELEAANAALAAPSGLKEPL